MRVFFLASLTITGLSLLQLPASASGPVWESGGTKCLPNFRNGKQVGYLCVKVEPGSIYGKIGIQKGDNVTQINGQTMAVEFEKANDLWKDFEKSTTATVQVERNGKLVELKSRQAD